MPKLYPSAVSSYDIDRGMPITCLKNMFVDGRGRLFISPCRGQDIYQNLNFYQYDGNKSHLIQFDSPDGKKISWYLKGLTNGGLLFGTDADNSFGFLYNPDNGSNQIASFDQAEKICNVVAGQGNEVYVLTYKPDAFCLYSYSTDAKKLLANIPFAAEPIRNKSCEVPATLSGNRFSFLLNDKGFVSYSLTDHSIKYYYWTDLIGSAYKGITAGDDPEQDYSGQNFTGINGDRLLFYLRSCNCFYVFDQLSEQLSRQPEMDGYFQKYPVLDNFVIKFFHDNWQNTLIELTWEVNPVNLSNSDWNAGVLLDKDGRFFDYKPVVQMAGAGRYNAGYGYFLNSRNYKEQLLIATDGGLIAVEVKNNLPVKTGVKGFACRTFGELDDNHILITSEGGNKVIMNLSTMQSTLISRWSKDPWSKVRNYGQLVSGTGQLWYPVEGKELACYHLSNRSFQYYSVGEEFDKFNFIQPREIALVNTKNEVFRYNLDQHNISPVGKNGVPLQLGGTANELFVDKSGVLWIASLNGLWRVEPQTGESKHLGKADGFVDDRIMCISEAENGEFWLGTLGGGIQFYNPKTGAMRVLDQNVGLSNNAVVGILIDNQGDRWVSTFNGITVISPEGNVLFELSEADGLAHKEFNRYSYLKTSGGQLLFGGVDGVTLLEPQKIKEQFTQTDSLRIYLTDIAYYSRSEGAEIHRTNRFNQLERLVLPAAHRYIKLDFGLSDYTAPEKCSFSYRLLHKGEQDSASDKEAIWTNIGSSSELLLNDLPVGSYTILIKGINSKGQLTVEPLAIPVQVQEFFYKSWWFYAICALPFMFGAYFWIHRLQTERERLEAEVANRTQQILSDKAIIEEQAAKLQELDELKSRFFTNISHEFRTPLTVITGMVTQIRKQPKEWLEKGMELIQRNSNQLLTLINQILDLRKLESGTLGIHLIRNNVVPYLHYIAESFVQMAQVKGLRIHVLENVKSIEMDYDPDKMMHILSNLLSNAIKYTPAPGDIYLQIGNGFSEGREQLLLQVRDTGQGIAAEALPHIFDQFYQVEDLATQKPQGSGVGLALTKELVKLLGGSIDVSSEPGAGSTFSLRFPITREAAVQESHSAFAVTEPQMKANKNTPEVARESEQIMEESALETEGKPRVLIVEDNADVRLYLQACLENQYQLLIAKDGEEGIDQALEQVPDLIVSDVMMPKKDGFALCDVLKNDERTSHIPIVLLTAKADFESRMKGLRRGADDYLTKPFEQEELQVRLEQLLTLRKKLQERYQNPSFSGQEPLPEAAETEDVFILKLRQLVLDHIEEEDYGIVPLCRALGVGRTQLHNKIKALTGRSTSEFVRYIRLNKARELLQTTDLNVSEVSYEVGISNPAYFSRIYAETFGEPPRETRR